MAVGNFVLYNQGKKRSLNGEIIPSHTFKALLCTAAYSPSGAHAVIGDVSANEHAATGGYGRITLATVAITESGGTVTFDCDDIDFGASVTLTAKYLIIYDDTHASDALLGYWDLNSGGGSVSSVAAPFKLTINAAGVYTAA